MNNKGNQAKLTFPLRGFFWGGEGEDRTKTKRNSTKELGGR